MGLGDALANWTCECGRHASIDHPFGGYCQASEIIKRLVLELEQVKTHHRYDLEQFRKCQDELTRLSGKTGYCLECEEQARLLGMSGSREAKLLAEVERLQKIIDAWPLVAKQGKIMD